MRKQYSNRPKVETHQKIADRILDMLEQGTVPWHKPWATAGRPMIPQISKQSGNAYTGSNQILLQMFQAFAGFETDEWATFKQIKAMGGSVRKGEKGCPLVFFSKQVKLFKGERPARLNKWYRSLEDFLQTAKERGYNPDRMLNEKGQVLYRVSGAEYKVTMILKDFTVFNLSQQDGVEYRIRPEAPAPEARNTSARIPEAEDIVTRWSDCPTITHGGNSAYYRPSTDSINVPAFEDFDGADEYYSTLYHEMSHSTGHQSRLSREGVTNHSGFGSHSYGIEELIAEFSASYLCGVAGIEKTIDNSASYIDSWIKTIKAQPEMVLDACFSAGKSANMILGI